MFRHRAGRIINCWIINLAPIRFSRANLWGSRVWRPLSCWLFDLGSQSTRTREIMSSNRLESNGFSVATSTALSRYHRRGIRTLVEAAVITLIALIATLTRKIALKNKKLWWVLLLFPLRWIKLESNNRVPCHVVWASPQQLHQILQLNRINHVEHKTLSIMVDSDCNWVIIRFSSYSIILPCFPAAASQRWKGVSRLFIYSVSNRSRHAISYRSHRFAPAFKLDSFVSITSRVHVSFDSVAFAMLLLLVPRRCSFLSRVSWEDASNNSNPASFMLNELEKTWCNWNSNHPQGGCIWFILLLLLLLPLLLLRSRNV